MDQNKKIIIFDFVTVQQGNQTWSIFRFAGQSELSLTETALEISYTYLSDNVGCFRLKSNKRSNSYDNLKRILSLLVIRICIPHIIMFII